MSHILELDGSACLASYEGWLLLFGQGSLFFFCPFSKAKIELPNCPLTEVTDHIAAFSSAPTAQDCTVAVVNRISFYELQLFMVCRGENVWTKNNFFGYNLNRIRTAFFYEGEGKEIHFLDWENSLIIFNASKSPQWKCYYMYPSTDLSSEVLVLSSEVLVLIIQYINIFEHHNDTGMVRYLEENDSISTCGTIVPQFRGKLDMVIGSESITAPNQSQTRHLKGYGANLNIAMFLQVRHVNIFEEKLDVT
ncbi:hypothetical protein VNO80_28775 [Phaseolus coccineus]|uniref:KIB1-4 beta-propeller domain-containing protein n=1 Tax=Phaseolus coccineus TaxID=3886 RepID=A0AAN9QEB1_PHACN